MIIETGVIKHVFYPVHPPETQMPSSLAEGSYTIPERVDCRNGPTSPLAQNANGDHCMCWIIDIRSTSSRNW